MIQFFLACTPSKTSHHRKRIVRRGAGASLVDMPALTRTINSYECMLLPHVPLYPMDGPLRLNLIFFFPYNKSCSKKFRIKDQPSMVRPDCTNLAKTFEDCLARMRFFYDDGQVADLHVQKYYSSRPGVSVCIAPWEPLI